MALPRSLLFASLALAANALPVESAEVELRVLTPDDFKSTVASGAWMIEHFSPYCGHCKAFKPTWEKLVKHYEDMDDPGVHLAQVDCAANGDLCNEHSVKGYPQMNMYVDGIMVEEFKGSREWNKVSAFIDKYAVHEPKQDIEETRPTTTTQAQSRPTTEKAPVNVVPENAPNKDGMVKALTSQNFSAFLDDGPVFVKFFAPWCGHCKKLAPTWTQLAASFRNRVNIAEVNCEAHKDICKQESIQGYPTLIYYTGGSGSRKHKTEYSGGRKTEQLRAFLEKAIAPPAVEIKSVADYESRVQEEAVLFLFLFGPSDASALNYVSQASSILLGSPQIYTSTNADLRSRFNLPPSIGTSPILLAIKSHSPYTYTSHFSVILSSMPTQEQVKDWLVRNKLPAVVSLEQDTFQDVMNAPYAPLVVLAAVPPAQSHEAREVLEKAHKTYNIHAVAGRDVVFTYMDSDRWASWLKSMYGMKASNGPAIIVTDHKRLRYYDTDAKGHAIPLEAESITKAVQDVVAGKVSYKYSENIVERLARRINDWFVVLEESVTAHPYRTILFVLVFLFMIFLAIRRLVSEDLPSYADYTKMQKAPNRLD